MVQQVVYCMLQAMKAGGRRRSGVAAAIMNVVSVHLECMYLTFFRIVGITLFKMSVFVVWPFHSSIAIKDKRLRLFSSRCTAASSSGEAYPGVLSAAAAAATAAAAAERTYTQGGFYGRACM